LGRLRPELFAAQPLVLRIVLELRRDILPVEDAPRLSRRAICGPLRADALQRAARIARPEGGDLLLPEPARRRRAAHALARLPVLRRQHLADAADAADVDVFGGERRYPTH